jgi:hypothetical protein
MASAILMGVTRVNTATHGRHFLSLIRTIFMASILNKNICYLSIIIYHYLIPSNIIAEDAADPSHIIPVQYYILSHEIVVYLYFVGR